MIKNKTFKKVLIVSFMIVIISSFIFLVDNSKEEEDRELIPEEALIPLKQFMEEQRRETITPFNLGE